MLIRYAVLCLVFLESSLLFAAQTEVIPQPASYQEKDGSFTLKRGGFVYARMQVIQKYLKMLNTTTSLELVMAPADVSCAI